MAVAVKRAGRQISESASQQIGKSANHQIGKLAFDHES